VVKLVLLVGHAYTAGASNIGTACTNGTVDTNSIADNNSILATIGDSSTMYMLHTESKQSM